MKNVTSKLMDDAANLNKRHFKGKAKMSFSKDENSMTLQFKLENPGAAAKVGFLTDAVSQGEVNVDDAWGDWGSWV